VADNGKRSIDERLDALTMNLELLSHSVEAHDRQIDKLTDALTKLVAVSNELVRISGAHERRIADLEDSRG
jgi:ABC-type transporter Mla subunit MlaD